MSRAAAALLGALAWPPDRARRLMLGLLGPVARPLVRDRELRVAVLGSAAIAGAWAAAVLVPLWLLALGPLVWGVPHLVSDVRYLVLRPGLHRDQRLLLLAGPPLVWAALGGGLMAGLAACAGALVAARVRTALAWGGLALAAAAAWAVGPARDLAFAHLHNLIALGIWVGWRRRRRRLHLAPLALALVGAGALLLGAADALVLGSGALDRAPGPALAFGAHVGELAPGLAAPWGARLVLSFAFLQSVHYIVWLRFVPDEASARETPRSYAASLRALSVELGPTVLLGVAVLATALAVWGLLDLAAARAGYLRLALFHGPLELVALLWAWTARRRPS